MALVLTAAATAMLVAGCGGSSSGASVPTLNWYVFEEPSGAFTEAAEHLHQGVERPVQGLDRGPADQRRPAARARRAPPRRQGLRHRHHRHGRDLDRRVRRRRDGSSRGPVANAAKARRTACSRARSQTAEYKGQLWTRRRSPPTRSCSGTARTWSKQPPKTWDEMIADAKELGADGHDRGPGRRYEGLTVWFNSLVASAGGTIVNAERRRRASDAPAVQAAEIMQQARDLAGGRTRRCPTRKEDQARLAFEPGRLAFQVNYPFVYAEREVGPTSRRSSTTWAGRASHASTRTSRAHVTLGGINLGVSAVLEAHPASAFEAATLPRSRRTR